MKNLYSSSTWRCQIGRRVCRDVLPGAKRSGAPGRAYLNRWAYGVILLTGLASGAWAKLPPLSAAAQAKASETAAKTAWSAKVDSYLLCKVQDKLAAQYKSSAAAVVPTPACVDPGPFVYTAPDNKGDNKPLEASGAHSPTTTAVSPPSTKQPDAVVNPSHKR